MGPLLRSLISAGLTMGVAEMLRGKAVAAPIVRRKILGGFLLFVALQLALLTIVSLISTLFFVLLDVPEGVRPALIAAGILALLALLSAWEGWQLIRR